MIKRNQEREKERERKMSHLLFIAQIPKVARQAKPKLRFRKSVQISCMDARNSTN